MYHLVHSYYKCIHKNATSDPANDIRLYFVTMEYKTIAPLAFQSIVIYNVFDKKNKNVRYNQSESVQYTKMKWI